MKKKGQRTFNNENVHRIKMLGLTLYPLYSPWLLDIFHQRGNVIDSSPVSKSSAPSERIGCVPFGESKNGFLILDLPDFAVKRNVKSEIGFVTLVTFRQRVQYARQPLKKWRVSYSLTNYAIYTVQNLVVGSSNSDDGTYKTDKERSALKLKII